MAKDRAKVGCNPRHPRHTVGVFLKKGEPHVTQVTIGSILKWSSMTWMIWGYPHFRNPPYIAKHQWMKNCRSSLCKLLALLPFPIQFCERTLNLNIHIKVLSSATCRLPTVMFLQLNIWVLPKGGPHFGNPPALGNTGPCPPVSMGTEKPINASNNPVSNTVAKRKCLERRCFSKHSPSHS